MLEFKKVAVIGLGYIGLPTAALIASRGIKVVGIDTNRRRQHRRLGRDPHFRARSRRPRAEGRVQRLAGRDERTGAGGRLHDRGADPDRQREPAGLDAASLPRSSALPTAGSR